MRPEPFQLIQATRFEGVFRVQCCILLPLKVLHDEVIKGPQARLTIDHVLTVAVDLGAGILHQAQHVQVLRAHDAL